MFRVQADGAVVEGHARAAVGRQLQAQVLMDAARALRCQTAADDVKRGRAVGRKIARTDAVATSAAWSSS